MTDRPDLPTQALGVAVNAALLSPTGDHRAAGMHRYLSGLLGAMARREGLALEVWAPGGRPDPGVVADAQRIRWHAAPPAAGRPLGRIAWEQTVLAAAIARGRGQVFHGPAHAMPLFCPRPAVVTAHDLSFVRLPEVFPRAQGWYLRAAMRHAARRARRLIAVSAFTKAELLAVYGVPASRVQVVLNGVDPACRPLPPAETAAWRAAAGLPERYVLAVGTLQPRKNLRILLEAWPGLVERLADPPLLVIAGAPGWGDTDLGGLAARLGIADRVRFPGFIPQDRLPWLYNGAAVLALPSRYEGFGLPVAEAMACGCPVVVATGSSLTEVAGDAALHAPPNDAAAWTAALARLLEDDALAADLRRRGLARAAELTWDRAAAATEAVYRGAAGDA
jgi:glycosyltransferase involved in cell wall biosynthesis